MVWSACLGTIIAILAAGSVRAPAQIPGPASEIAWEIEVSEKMSFSPDHFYCSPGQPIVIRVKNTIPPHSAEYFHSLVVLDSAVNLDVFGAAAIKASKANDYVPDDFKSRILGHTRLVGPGEQTELRLKAPLAPGSYPVACSFPGHCTIGMRGLLIVR